MDFFEQVLIQIFHKNVNEIGKVPQIISYFTVN
jgi:hypothetical protein